ncbi:MAG: phosphatidylserine decarboxylase [Deltaproteobacteria bacterium]|nr:phosphatidylserine decarboxylase [Deltaproteobacteria bacterium]
MSQPSALRNVVLEIVARLPQNAMSRAVGVAARTRRPRRVAKIAVRAFARAMGIDVGEAELPIGEYASVHDFFVRKLRRGARKIDARPDQLVSPCDGVLGESGVITGGKCLQAKGREYTVKELLQNDALAARFEGGTFVTIYLSPRHYHRVHSPVAGGVFAADHLPGQLLPVNIPSINKFDGVFCKNERLTTWIASDGFGTVGVTMVGATCVGEMTFAYDASLVTNRGTTPVHRSYEPAIRVHKGEELGTFHMGSTVVMLFEPKKIGALAFADGAELKMGEALAQRGRT